MLNIFGLAALIAINGFTAQAGPSGPAAAAPQAEAVPQDAVRLVLDAFFVIRMLDEKDYEARKAEVAANLVTNLRPFLVPRPTPAAPAPVAAKPPTPARAAVPPRPASAPVSTPATAKPQSAAAAAYAKVPQKTRIRAKFAAAEAPYKALVQTDPGQAEVVAELLKAARSAFAKGEFDVSESYVDHALRLMGVEFKQ